MHIQNNTIKTINSDMHMYINYTINTYKKCYRTGLISEQFHAIQSTSLPLAHTLENKQLETKH